ncbi:tegument serine/threonine protein kinase [Equid alphaherpesvirus 4]|uniref:Tegument serine/threonine protein kinase n=1 Tax=Equid alphaherpesvirus 4 TaxID=10331 RepID=A0A0X9ZH36_9ALPH|nr:tegument serine/threonine protein kinase [Equid alphaherpesvirus 4]AMB16166.1 tegument serine/threonine protein kinase [Equid alphaherpesvirus 4]AMB16245.1 tegument serine/threonine protein kinase [Equid alphaherpesvirus 4]BAV93414.1 tegument serine/threonine protein kinase [Equid alphaherpesvirus 4]
MARSRGRSSVDEMDVGGSTTSEYENCDGPSFSPLNMSCAKKSTKKRSLRSSRIWGGKSSDSEHTPLLTRNTCGATGNTRRKHAGISNHKRGASLNHENGDKSFQSGHNCPRIRASAVRCGAATRKIVRITEEGASRQDNIWPGQSGMAGWHSPPKRRRTPSRHGDSNHERSHLSGQPSQSVVRVGGRLLTQTPLRKTIILQPKLVRKVFMPTFTVNPGMHYRRVSLGETPKFGGAGSYGEVQIFKQNGLAIKTSSSRSCFEHELAVSLLTGECSLRAQSTLGIGGIICLMAFSLPSKQMVFPAYDADLNAYGYRLSRNGPPSVLVTESIERAFIGLGRALVYLNTSCGLTHLDVKGGNIFVNHSHFVISDCVIGDLSLMTLNTNSMAMRAEFEIDTGEEEIKTLRLPKSASQMTFSFVVGHGHNQPLSVIADFINNSGLAKNTGPIKHDVGLAVDLYALGQALLDLLLVGCISPCLSVPILRTATYYYYSNRLSVDYALDLLAYRCSLYPAIFPTTPLTTIYGIPWDQVEGVFESIAGAHHREAFRAHLDRYRLTHRRLFASIRIPSAFTSVLELVSLLCHSNEKARLSIPLLWTPHP